MAGVGVAEPSKVAQLTQFFNTKLQAAEGATKDLHDKVSAGVKDVQAKSLSFTENLKKKANAVTVALKPEPSPQAAPLATGLGGEKNGGRRRRVRKSNKKKKSSNKNKNKKRSSKRKTKKRVRFSRRVKSRRI